MAIVLHSSSIAVLSLRLENMIMEDGRICTFRQCRILVDLLLVCYPRLLDDISQWTYRYVNRSNSMYNILEVICIAICIANFTKLYFKGLVELKNELPFLLTSIYSRHSLANYLIIIKNTYEYRKLSQIFRNFSS